MSLVPSIYVQKSSIDHSLRAKFILTPVQILQLDVVNYWRIGGDSHPITSHLSEGVFGLEGDERLFLEIHVFDRAFESVEDIVVFALADDKGHRPGVKNDASL